MSITSTAPATATSDPPPSMNTTGPQKSPCVRSDPANLVNWKLAKFRDLKPVGKPHTSCKHAKPHGRPFRILQVNRAALHSDKLDADIASRRRIECPSTLSCDVHHDFGPYTATQRAGNNTARNPSPIAENKIGQNQNDPTAASAAVRCGAAAS
jgi:hypothetical protein